MFRHKQDEVVCAGPPRSTVEIPAKQLPSDSVMGSRGNRSKGSNPRNQSSCEANQARNSFQLAMQCRASVAVHSASSSGHPVPGS